MNQTIVFMCYGAIAAGSTFLLQKVGLTAVVASCLVGLLGACLSYFLKSADVAAMVFIGSFVGMTSLTIGHLPMMLVGGAISGVVFSVSEAYFVGHGGRMGTIAFISLLISMGLIYLLQVLLRTLK